MRHGAGDRAIRELAAREHARRAAGNGRDGRARDDAAFARYGAKRRAFHHEAGAGRNRAGERAGHEAATLSDRERAANDSMQSEFDDRRRSRSGRGGDDAADRRIDTYLRETKSSCDECVFQRSSGSERQPGCGRDAYGHNPRRARRDLQNRPPDAGFDDGARGAREQAADFAEEIADRPEEAAQEEAGWIGVGERVVADPGSILVTS